MVISITDGAVSSYVVLWSVFIDKSCQQMPTRFVNSLPSNVWSGCSFFGFVALFIKANKACNIVDCILKILFEEGKIKFSFSSEQEK